MAKKKRLLFVLVGFALLGCSKDDKDANNPTGNNDTLPAGIAGQVVNMACTFANTGAPYVVGDEARFTFSSSGALFIDTDPAASNGDEIQVKSFTKVNNEYIWSDVAGGYKYVLSLSPDNSINEVNVLDQSNAFLNQFEPVQQGSPELALIKAMAGTYTVSAVSRGIHSRMRVTIGADGSIDFDTNDAYAPDTYALVTDRLNVLDQVFVDIDPYPTEPYARFEITVDANDPSIPVEITYTPDYPGVGNRVTVSL